MIEIRATADDAKLSGSVADLDAIRAAIVRLINSNEQQYVEAAYTNAASAPYDRHLNKIRVVRGVGPTRVSIVDDALEVAGGDENLAGFASWFAVERGQHGHFEFFEGNKYIAPDSIALVVAAKPE